MQSWAASPVFWLVRSVRLLGQMRPRRSRPELTGREFSDVSFGFSSSLIYQLVDCCKRYHGASSSPAVREAAAKVRANCRLEWEATAPHTALPRASPPCKTSTYMEITRARTQAGAAVCAATFSVARILIHASPAAAEKADATASEGERTRPKSDTAKITMANAMTASGEKRLRATVRTAAPASAPNPKNASIAPKPSAPNLLAINGSNAQNTLAKSENNRVRTSTVRIRESWHA